MASFDSFVSAAQPAACAVTAAGTRGSSWEGALAFDIDGDPVDFTGCTGTVKLYDSPTSAAAAISLTVTFPGSGVVKWTAAPAATDVVPAGRYLFEGTATNASGRKVTLWGTDDSVYVVERKGA